MKTYKKFQEFLAEECYSEIEYGDGEYDRKIWNWFMKDATVPEEEHPMCPICHNITYDNDSLEAHLENCHAPKKVEKIDIEGLKLDWGANEITDKINELVEAVNKLNEKG